MNQKLATNYLSFASPDCDALLFSSSSLNAVFSSLADEPILRANSGNLFAPNNISKITSIHNFSATYNCSSYGAGSYTNGQPCTTTGHQESHQGSSTSYQTVTQSSNLLENTGESLFIGLAIGISLIVIAIILLINKKRHSKNK